MHCLDNSLKIPCPSSCTKHSQMVPPVGVGANYTWYGRLEYSEYLPRRHFGNIYCEYSQYIKVLYLEYCMNSKYFGVRHRWYCMYSGFCSAHTPSTRSIWAFSSAHTPSTRSILAACTPILSVLGVCSILGASVQPRSFSPSFFLCVSYTHAASGLLSRSMELLAIRKSSVCTQNRGPLCPLHSFPFSCILPCERA